MLEEQERRPTMIPTTEIAPGLAVAAQIARSDLADFARAGIRTVINNRPDGEQPGQLPQAEARAEAERHGLAYIYMPVTAATIGTADVAAFERALKESARPIVAHCRSGTRTYLLWAAAQVLNHGADASALVAEAAAKGFDIKALPVLLAGIRGS
jgi:uncharacterized protein (TIGR01244 family)